jgi:hypothetical protein
MALSFNHGTKRIGVPQVDAVPLMMQALINAIREEEASERGITYDQIADAAGKDDLGGGVETGITVSLRSTWLLEFASGAYQAAVDGGNLADGLNRIYNTGSPQVVLRSSAAATLITGDGGGTAPTAQQNAAAVWASVLEGTLTAEQMQRLLLAVLAGKVSGAGTSTERFRDLADTKDRVVVTADESGNRSTVVVDGT